MIAVDAMRRVGGEAAASWQSEVAAAGFPVGQSEGELAPRTFGDPFNKRHRRRARRRHGLIGPAKLQMVADSPRRPGAFCEAPAGLPEVGLNGQDSTESLVNRTEPSPMSALSPPGCMLDAEFVQAVIEAPAILSQALGG